MSGNTGFVWSLQCGAMLEVYCGETGQSRASREAEGREAGSD